MKGALHVHSTCSDGTLTVPELASIYADLGFSFLALTDHDYLLRGDAYDRQLEGVQTDLILFRGVELTVFEKGLVHVGRIHGDSEVLHVFNHPAKLHLSLARVRERLKAIEEKFPIDAIEITEDGFYTPEYDVPEIPLPKIATDDAHAPSACGRAWVEVDCPPAKDAILRAIRNGDFRNGFVGSTPGGA